MSYINRKRTEDAIRKYADQKHSNGEQIEYINGILKAISVINEQPAADVEEVKHGCWVDCIEAGTTVAGIEFSGLVGYKCSLCGRYEGKKEPYCNCGAKMDGRKGDAQCLN